MHKWKFFRAGGVEQVVLSSGSDLANLADLDLKLWTALAMPIGGVHLDSRTLELVDSDSDERVRANEVLAAVRFVRDALTDLDGLFDGRAEVPLAKIKDGELSRTARRVATAGLSDATFVSLAQVSDAETRFAALHFNGDGVITNEVPGDESLASVIADAMATYGTATDRSGHFGIDAAILGAFLADAKSLSAWLEAGTTADKRPLGDRTETAADRLRELAPKLEDYFTRVRLQSFDARVATAAHGSDADFAALAGKDLARDAAELRKFPLAKVGSDAVLAFEGAVNPAYAGALVAFRDDVVRPMLGATTSSLTDVECRGLIERFAPYEAWRAAKPKTKLDGLSTARVRELADGVACEKLAALIAEDLAEKGEYDRIEAVERLVRYHRDLVPLLKNYVSFEEFYAKKLAAFQTGTLYLDGRSCDLCIDVADTTKHSTLASHASTYLAYCECVRPGSPKRTIVAAFTAGDSDNLMVGRNGVFYDREGNDWDATITKVVENPISIREAFFAPYKKLIRFVEDQVGRRAAAANDEAQAAAQANVTAVIAKPDPAAPAAAAPAAAPVAAAPKSRFDVGTIAALGVAIGGVGAMVTGLLSAFFGLGAWMPLGILGGMLMISGPSMLLAYLKLRRRNLGPLLDASGWAVNGLVRINVPFGGALTSVAALPKNAERRLRDPYAQERPVWPYAVAVVLLAVTTAWGVGALNRYLPTSLRSPGFVPPPAIPAAR